MIRPALVLGGGNALGAYHLGVWAGLEAAGIEPGWVVGASIGAVCAALIAGNPPDRRQSALRRFWHQASAFDAATMLPPALRQPLQYAQALSSRLLGRPPLFRLRPPDLSGNESRPGLFDAGPMKALLAELVDLDRLNSGAMRVSVLAVDLATCREVVFDTNRERLDLDHVMASAALLPDFPPVEVGGRLLVDGGLAANLPVHLVLDELRRQDRSERVCCVASDLFPASAPLPRGILEGAQRQNDLIFASQTRRTLRACSMDWQDQSPGADLVLVAYQALKEETALKGFDFSAGTLARRELAGTDDIGRQVSAWQAAPAHSTGLTIHSDDLSG